jgi:dTDP-4-amino-4,6-dideoxygalactose transaminase
MLMVTKCFLPPIEKYNEYIKKIFERNILTNQGPCVVDLELRLCDYMGLENLHFLSNGTIALQVALRALDITEGEVITTPFSYVATISSILWERCSPVFVDIEPDNFTINPELIESAIMEKTKAIMPVHVFGYVCDIEAIEKIAQKYHLKVIYDGAHAFRTRYKGKSALSYGDISICSFHATKLFHTIEGGACIVKDSAVSEKISRMKRFGHLFDDHICLGINAKNSEFHAAMGLANLEYVDSCVKIRQHICELYDSLLTNYVVRPKRQSDIDYNYAYYPVLFENEEQLLRVFAALYSENIFPRRYFYPSLNKLPYLRDTSECPVSENISLRVACLPLYVGLTDEEIKMVSNIIIGAL